MNIRNRWRVLIAFVLVLSLVLGACALAEGSKPQNSAKGKPVYAGEALFAGANANADPYFRNVPAWLYAGDKLTGSFSAEGEGDNFVVELQNEAGDLLSKQKFTKTSGSFTFGGDLLSDPGVYTVVLWFYQGEERLNGWALNVVVLEKNLEEKIELTINGSKDDVEALCYDNMRVAVSAPGATALRVYDGYGWQYWNCYENPEYIEFDWGFDIGDYAFVAEACYDEYDPDEEDFDWESLTWSGVSNIIQVAVTAPYGTLAEPDATVPAAVERGENLVIRIKGQDKGEWYHANVFALEDDGEGHERYERVASVDWDEDISSISVSTLTLEPGEYAVRVNTYAPGWNVASVETRVTVTQPQEDFDLKLVASRDTAPTHAQVRFEVYAQDCDWFEINLVQEGNDGWEDRYEFGGESDTWYYGFDHEGTYTATLKAYYYNAETGMETDRTAEPVSVKITANGTLEAPQFVSVPSVIHSGEALEGTFKAPGAGWCYINVHGVEYGDWMWIAECDAPVDEEGNGSFSFAGGYFKTDGETWPLVVRLHANQSGMNSAYQEKTVLLVPDGIEENKVTLTVNGSKDDFEALSSEDVHISVNAPGATAVRVLNGNEWEYFLRDDEGELNTDFEDIWWGWGSGTVMLVAQACYDDYDQEFIDESGEEALIFTAISNAVNGTITSPYGELAKPDVTLPASVKRGEMITVQMPDQGVGEWYWADVDCQEYDSEDDDDWWWSWRGHYDWDEETRTLTIPTLNLEPGEAKIRIGVDAVGYDGIETVQYVTIEEPAEEIGVTVQVSKAEALTNEEIMIYAYAPGADWISAVIRPEGNEDWEDWREEGRDFGNWRWSSGETGDYTITPIGHYWDEEAEDEYEETGKPVKVSITANGALEPAVLNVPATLKPGESLYVSFDAVEDAEWYFAELNSCGEYGYEWDRLWEENLQEAGSFAFDGSYFEKPGIYSFMVTACARGKENSHADVRFHVTDAVQSGKVVLKIEGSEESATVRAHEPFTVEVEAPGAEAVRIFNGYEWNDYWMDFNGSEIRTWDWEEGTNRLMAQACYDVDHSKSNEDQNWTDMSNVVVLTVEPPQGVLSVPEITVPESVDRGEFLTIQVGKVENAEYYELYIDEFDEDWEYMDCVYDERFSAAGEIPLATGNLIPGRNYALHLAAIAVGYREAWTDYFRFSVTESAAYESTFKISKTKVAVNEEFAVSIYAPGADAVRLCHNEVDNVWREEYSAGLATTARIDQDTGEEGWNLMAFASWNGGATWTQIGETIPVVATSTAAIAEPQVDAEETVYANEDVVITVHGVENGFHYFLNVNRNGEEGEGDDWICDRNGVIKDSNGTWTVRLPASLFTPGDSYFAFVQASAKDGVTGMKPGVSVIDFAVSTQEHEWNAPTYEWAEDNSTVTAKRVCKGGSGHTEEETVTTTVETVEATTESAGQSVYTAKFENPAFETQTKTVEIPIIPKSDVEIKLVKAKKNTPETAVMDGTKYVVVAQYAIDNNYTDVTFKSSSKKIATIDSKTGELTLLKAGKTTVTATAKNGKKKVTATVVITVKDPSIPDSIQIDQGEEYTVFIGNNETYQLTVTANPAPAADNTVTWKSAGAKIVKVDKNTGVLTPVKAGSAKVTATSTKAKKVKATITVKVIDLRIPTQLTIDQGESIALSLGKNVTASLTVTAEPAATADKAVTWKSSNAKIVKVDGNGVITAVKAGTAKITATSVRDKKVTKTIEVKVDDLRIPAGVKIKAPASLNVPVKGTLALETELERQDPEVEVKGTVTWSTSNKKIATVSKAGVVKGVKAGTVTITATVTTPEGKRSDTIQLNIGEGAGVVALEGEEPPVEEPEPIGEEPETEEPTAEEPVEEEPAVEEPAVEEPEGVQAEPEAPAAEDAVPEEIVPEEGYNDWYSDGDGFGEEAW